MADPSELNCNYCDKRYDNRGWLQGHIKKFHEDAQYLDKSMTVLRDVAQQDESFQEAGLNLSENPHWEGLEDEEETEDEDEHEDEEEPKENNSSTPTSEPSLAPKVPLCPNANTYIVEKGKKIPASFLTTFLPPPGFLKDLNNSLNQDEEHPVNNLLDQFEKKIRCYKCNECDFTCLGTNNIKKHKSSNHTDGPPPSSVDNTQHSLGVYLTSLEHKIDRCTEFIVKQSALTSRQSIMIEQLLNLHRPKTTASTNYK